MSRGEFDEAFTLLDDTELMASDVKDLTDDIEERQVNDLLIHIQQALAEGELIGEQTKPNGRLHGSSGAFMRIGAGRGAGLAIRACWLFSRLGTLQACTMDPMKSWLL